MFRSRLSPASALSAIKGNPVAGLPLVFILGMSLLFLLPSLDRPGLLNNNEGLYAEVAREMLRGAGYLIPRLDGLPYLEKPPLLYYALATSFSLLGVSTFSARLVPAAAAFSCLLGVLWLGRRGGLPQTGRLAAAILVSSAGFALVSRAVMTDMLFIAFLTWALFLAWAGLEYERPPWVRASHTCLALAVLTKGLVALALYGLVLGGFLLVAHRARFRVVLKKLLDPVGLGLFLLIAAPWHLLAALGDPDFAWFYFVNEHVLRFLGLRQPQDFYTGPIYYYLPRLVLLFFPWSAFFLFLPRARPWSAGPGRSLIVFLWLAWLAPFVFFSLSVAKANYYLIVALPPLALLTAYGIEAALAQGKQTALAVAALIPGVLALALEVWLAGAFYHGRSPLPAFLTDPDALLTALALTALCSGAAARAVWTGRKVAFVAALCLTTFALGGYFLHAAQENEPELSARPLARYLQAAQPGRLVFIYRDFERISALPFYLQQPVGVVDSASNDLKFGIEREGSPSWFMTSDEFWLRCAETPVLLVVLRDRLGELGHTRLAQCLHPAAQIGSAWVWVNGWGRRAENAWRLAGRR